MICSTFQFFLVDISFGFFFYIFNNQNMEIGPFSQNEQYMHIAQCNLGK
jgi:hypothetical protein